MKFFHHAALLAVALAAGACTVTEAPPVARYAPPGVHVQPEVAQGFAAYETVLAAWGFWSADRRYGVHWCPRHSQTGGPDAPFQPYLDRGHWDVSDAPIGRAPAGSPVWTSEDSDTWGEITTHRGWWVQAPQPGGSRWCWVPGLEETPARVAWREGDGFVGWAPELPFWIAADDADDDDSLDWVYTLLGTLLDPSPDQNTLSGDARKVAQAGTTSHGASRQRQQVGPSGTSVAAARQILATYVAQHPEAMSAAIHATATPAASGSSASKSRSGSKSTTEKAVASAPSLPFAMAYYDAFQMEPVIGPAGLVPSPRAGVGGGGGGAGAGSGAAGSATSARSGAAGGSHARSAEAALRAPTPAATAEGSSSASNSYASSSSGSRSSSKSSKSRSKSKSRR